MLVPVLCLLTFLFTSRIVLAQSEPIGITADLTEAPAALITPRSICPSS